MPRASGFKSVRPRSVLPEFGRRPGVWRAVFALVCAIFGGVGARGAASLDVVRESGGGVRLSVEAGAEDVVVMERTADFTGWTEWIRGHGPIRGVADLPVGAVDGARFYRALTRSKGAADDWKNTVVGGPDEPFQSEAPPPWLPSPRWIKFVMPLDGTRRVFFQDSGRYSFHYDFAVARLPEFKGMTRDAFDAVTLRSAGQRAVLGALLFPPTAGAREVGIQIVGQDAFSREQVAEWFGWVRAMIQAPEGLDLFYLPTYEQQGVALANRDWFQARGIEIGSASRWVTVDECYSDGWALGRMVMIPADQIRAASGDGRLRSEDILLTDAVPAEVPPLAGIVSLTPATPNSHVALLAKAYGVPFVHLTDPGAEARLRGWDGQDVVVRAVSQFGGCIVAVDAVTGGVEPGLRAEILRLKEAPDLAIPARAVRGALSVGLETATPADIRYVGGKAANFGVLRRALPEASPAPAMAFTFDLWAGYLQQPMPGGGTLSNWVSGRLSAFQWPPDMAALQKVLEEVRTTFRSGTDFTPAQKQAILDALNGAGFEPGRRIRFRSSTNVEDSEQFSGAGLYDSYSGCLADDLDADDAGPSRCDPEEPAERGVFRALRRVYASFYNDNAVLERLRHKVDEAAVGMAVLVHYSLPDEDELANGVATLEVRRDEFGRYVNGTLVSQVGAVSVTNPDGAARPEEMRAYRYVGEVPSFEKQRSSSLVPLGGTVLGWETEYLQLFRLLDRAALQWAQETAPAKEWFLDFEYKKERPGGLRVKQIRPIPRPAPVRSEAPWLLNVSREWEVLQGEHSDLMAVHRLKSTWRFETRSTRLVASNLTPSVLTRLEGRWGEGAGSGGYTGLVRELPGHVFKVGAEFNEDSWTSPSGKRTLIVERVPYIFEGRGPLADLGDLRVELRMDHTTPQPVPEWPGIFELGGPGPVETRLTNRETVTLGVRTTVGAGSKLQQRRLSRGRWTVETRFYWPPEPKGIVAGYTAPLQAWVETTLTGFSSKPLVLRGELSQTYRPGHHNFWEDFVFEPGLEPGMDPALLEEMRAANIRAVLIGGDRERVTTLAVLGWDGKFRDLE